MIQCEAFNSSENQPTHKWYRTSERAFPNAKLVKGTLVRHIKIDAPPHLLHSKDNNSLILMKTLLGLYGLPLTDRCGFDFKDLAFGNMQPYSYVDCI